MKRLFSTAIILLIVVSLAFSQSKVGGTVKIGGVTKAGPTGGGASSLLTGLVFYSKHEQATGANLVDEINSHTMTHHATTNNVTSVTGKIGQGSDFVQASIQYFDVADHADFDASTAFTFTTWFTTSGALDSVLLSKWDYGTSAGYTISLDAAGDEIRVWVASDAGDGGSNYVETTDADIAPATMYFLAVVYDGSQGTNTTKIKIYINAVLKSEAATGTIDTALVNNAVPFTLGYWPGLSRNWDGIMDETGFWKDVALSSTQITCLYDSGSPDSAQQPPTFSGCP